MTNEVVIKGKTITYDATKDKVYNNGNLTYEYRPVFIPNGDEEPTFFGFAGPDHKVYDIYGNVSDIVDSNKITL